MLKAHYQKYLFGFEEHEYWKKEPTKVPGDEEGTWVDQRVGSGGILGAGRTAARLAELEEAVAANSDSMCIRNDSC